MPPGPTLLRAVLARHRLLLMLRLGGLAGTVAAATALISANERFWGVVVAGVALAQVPGLLRFVERPGRDLLRFLEGVRNDDLSVSFQSTGEGPLVQALHAAFTEVSEAFRRVRSEREEQAYYLQTVVRHVGVALVVFRDDGEVALCNQAATRLLGLARPRSLDALALVHPTLVQALRATRAGERALVEVVRDDHPLTLVLHTTRFQLGGTFYTLVSLQDIRPELERKEGEAWQQLTRVLTHEIMNSVTPIASLAATASDLLTEEAYPPRGVVEALQVIERRCEGLIHFVDAYRSLARLPEPRLAITPVRDLVGGIYALLRATAAERGVALSMHVEPAGLEAVADADLIEQALMNVVLNAIQAVDGRPDAAVRIVGRTSPFGRPVLEVTDNGPGILPDVQERIFLPFFTTKREGSGIGLSLARQILRLHGGTLTVQSRPDVETTFTLRF